MLYAAINVKSKRVEDLMVSGPMPEAMRELVELHNRYSEAKVTSFASLDEARSKTLAVISARYFPEVNTSAGELGPVARARLVFQEYEGRPRREIIEACAKLGIKRSTTATQYQRWKKEREKQSASH